MGAPPNLLFDDAARMLCRAPREEHGDPSLFKTSNMVFPKNTAISQLLKRRTSFVSLFKCYVCSVEEMFYSQESSCSKCPLGPVNYILAL